MLFLHLKPIYLFSLWMLSICFTLSGQIQIVIYRRNTTGLIGYGLQESTPMEIHCDPTNSHIISLDLYQVKAPIQDNAKQMQTRAREEMWRIMTWIRLDLFIPKEKVIFKYIFKKRENERERILRIFFLFGNLSPPKHQIGSEEMPRKRKSIYFLHVTKEILGWNAILSTSAHFQLCCLPLWIFT